MKSKDLTTVDPGSSPGLTDDCLARIIHEPQRLYVTKNTKNRLGARGTDGVHPFGEAFVLSLGFVYLCVFVFPAYAGTGVVAHE